MTADAWATAMMVLGQERGLTFARTIGLSVLFISGDGMESVGTGSFAPVTPPPMTGAGPFPADTRGSPSAPPGGKALSFAATYCGRCIEIPSVMAIMRQTADFVLRETSIRLEDDSSR
jgi:hypothetical protein